MSALIASVRRLGRAGGSRGELKQLIEPMTLPPYRTNPD
jgi:hypothetical protein